MNGDYEPPAVTVAFDGEWLEYDAPDGHCRLPADRGALRVVCERGAHAVEYRVGARHPAGRNEALLWEALQASRHAVEILAGHVERLHDIVRRLDPDVDVGVDEGEG